MIIVIIRNHQDAGVDGYLHAAVLVVAETDGGAFEMLQHILEVFLAEKNDKIVSAQAADDSAVADDLLQAGNVAFHDFVAELPAELLVDQREMFQVKTGGAELVQLLPAADAVDHAGKIADIGISRVVIKRRAPDHHLHPVPADKAEHHPLDQPDAVQLLLRPGRRPGGVVYLTGSDHHAGQLIAAGEDLIRFHP